jgi:beta-lactam-binding protein with PASTA domain
VQVPDIRGKSVKDIEKLLRGTELRLGAKRGSCEELGSSTNDTIKADRGRVICQSPAPGEHVAPDTEIDYVLAGGRGENDD